MKNRGSYYCIEAFSLRTSQNSESFISKSELSIEELCPGTNYYCVDGTELPFLTQSEKPRRMITMSLHPGAQTVKCPENTVLTSCNVTSQPFQNFFFHKALFCLEVKYKFRI